MGFGYDMARVNAHIHRMTGKWGKLKTESDVREYMATHDLTERPETAEKPKSITRSGPLPHGLQRALRYDLDGGWLTISSVDEYGDAKKQQRRQKVDRDGTSTVWQCQDDHKYFKTWESFLGHAITSINAAKSMQKD